jgi:nicotinate-nucleotide adenylyltransferase
MSGGVGGYALVVPKRGIGETSAYQACQGGEKPLVRAPCEARRRSLPTERSLASHAGTAGKPPSPRRRLLHSDAVPSAAVHRPARIGLFGGTFDPPHVGHLVTAVNVRHALGLDRVILMVANVPWQKQGERAITLALDRLAMVEAAVADVPGLEAGRLEIDAGGPSYTADTLATLAELHPGAELFTIVGDDAAAGLRTWERYEEVIAQSRLVVVDRPGEPVRLSDDIDWIHVEVPRLEVSSTDLRARFNDGRPLDYLLTDAVLHVIRQRGLYAEPAAQLSSKVTA